MEPTTRRRFLELAVGAAGAAACSSASSPADVGDVDAGNIGNLPIGTLRTIGSQPVCIGRDSGGVYAMTLTCTHQGCNMAVQGSVSPRGIECACHGSSFDVDGNVLGGPARAALDHFAVTLDAGGELTIHGGQQVDATARLNV